ncbi:hypothetical protein BDV59DRAFT_78617 [Aspergillus ambiguus]|uniref:uncharacterized protein n=1 Tax=Aspergillus ambiguus TaxID=176160 RepID=UPI003CCCC9D8
MFLRRVLFRLLSVLLPLAITSSLYLYLYPVFHRCAFPLPGDPHGAPISRSFVNTLRQHIGLQNADEPAIFRLLVLADPQLEGDSSLPKPENELSARIQQHWAAIRSAGNESSSPSPSSSEFPAHRHVYTALCTALRTLAADDIPRALRAARKRLDLLGNDYYLAHIYRTLHWWSRPTHVTVLGDLIGSQWVTDGEFERRGGRYWGRVFRGGERVGDEVTDSDSEAGRRDLEMLSGAPDNPWARRIINIVGNHDVGYSGDASEARLERFERMFGRANWDVRFQHPPLQLDNNRTVITPTLHLINLNTLTLDAPPFSAQVQAASYAYINDLILERSYPVEDRTTFTLLLTHLPLHKPDGVCTDGPYASFFDADDENSPDGVPRFRAGGLREQNHLSRDISASGVLQGVYGMTGDEDGPAGGWGRNGLILTGHDHTGCDVVHYVDRAATEESDASGEGEARTWRWNARRYGEPSEESQPRAPSIREVTLRSMMGEYGGYAGLLSVWFDADPAVREWRYAITMCSAGVQHVWWAVHVLDVVTVLLVVVYSLLRPGSGSTRPSPGVQAKEVKGGK